MEKYFVVVIVILILLLMIMTTPVMLAHKILFVINVQMLIHVHLVILTMYYKEQFVKPIVTLVIMLIPMEYVKHVLKVIVQFVKKILVPNVNNHTTFIIINVYLIALHLTMAQLIQ